MNVLQTMVAVLITVLTPILDVNVTVNMDINWIMMALLVKVIIIVVVNWWHINRCSNVIRALVGGGGVYLYIRVLPD